MLEVARARRDAGRIPLSEVGNRVWCALDGELFLARVAVDESGRVYLERVMSSVAAVFAKPAKVRRRYE